MELDNYYYKVDVTIASRVISYFAFVVPLIYPAKTLIRDKITPPASNMLDPAEPFSFDLSLLNAKISRACN